MSIMFLPLRLIPVPMQCVVVSTVLNLVLQRDASLREQAYDLDSRVFRIHVSDTGALFFLVFRDGRVCAHPRHEGDVDVRISAETSGFARMVFAHEDPDELVFRQVLCISGDSESMLRFKKLMQTADVSWEHELELAFGNFFGRRVAKAATLAIQTEEKLRQGVHDVLQQGLHELHIPDEQSMQRWQAGVEHLQHRIHRLEQRISQAEHRLHGQVSVHENRR
ncbi:MAG: SCP2 sterol-binding domain-containing protein [Mariprofundaceae bacterium]|nr:SCP2 sterol-binding domain-containing protein [Mariprofundaceae bacterium]